MAEPRRTIRDERFDPRQSLVNRRNVKAAAKRRLPAGRRVLGNYHPRLPQPAGDPASPSGTKVELSELAEDTQTALIDDANRRFLEFNTNGPVIGALSSRSFLLGGSTPTTLVGYRLPREAVITSVSAKGTAIDAAQNFAIEILANSSSSPSVLATLPWPAGTLDNALNNLNISVPVGVEVGARVVRLSGGSNSTFTRIALLVEVSVP